MNDDRQAAFVYASNWLTLCTDMVHMGEILEIAYGRRWTSRRMNWMRKGVEVGLYISNVVYGSTCGQLLAESAVLWYADVIHHSEDFSSGGTDIGSLWSFWMQMFILRNESLAANNDCMHCFIQLLSIHWLLVCHQGEHQRSINDFLSYIFGNHRAA